MIYARLFYVFAKLGLFTYGGGYAIIALLLGILKEYNWVTSSEFSNLVAISQITPGPIAINAATFVGYKVAGVLGSAVTRCLNLTMSMTGLTEKKASALGFKPVSVTVTKNDKVGYMPNVNNITLKLTADYETGKLLGGQAVGAGDADKRINSLAAALLAGMTVEEFYNNDLTYAPPFSPTIDPLLNAAQMLMSKIMPKD